MNNEELVRRYKEIYKRKSGKDLSDQDALEQAIALITLVDVVCRPIPKQDHGNTKSDNR